MKNFFTLFLATAALFTLGGCSDGDDPATPVVTELIVAPLSLTFGAEGAEPQRVSVETNASEWQAVPDDAWLHVTMADDGFTVAADNWDGEAERSSSVTVTAGKKIERVAVVQLASPKPVVRTVRVVTLPDELLGELFGGQVSSVSPNGQWVVGYSDYSYISFIWSRSTGEFELITGVDGAEAVAEAVADDGTVVGYFTDADGNPMPGIYKAGQWTALPLIDGVPVSGYDNGSAVSISADGRTVTGYVNMLSHRSDPGKEVTVFRPVVWVDGQLKDTLHASSLPDADKQQSGYWLLDGSADGRVLGGVADFTSGTRAPAVWVDGELTRIYGKEDIDPDVSQDFFDGMVTSISPDGHYAAGYFSAAGDYSDAVSFVYDTQTGTHEEIASIYAASLVLDDGTVFGTNGYMGEGAIRRGDFSGLLQEWLIAQGMDPATENIPSVVFASDSACTVLGGYAYEVYEFGPVNVPAFVVIE